MFSHRAPRTTGFSLSRSSDDKLTRNRAQRTAAAAVLNSNEDAAASCALKACPTSLSFDNSARLGRPGFRRSTPRLEITTDQVTEMRPARAHSLVIFQDARVR